MLSRRSFLPLLAAPAIIRVADLMTIKPLPPRLITARMLPNGTRVVIEPQQFIGVGDVVLQDSNGLWRKIHAGDMFITAPRARVWDVNERGDVAVGQLLKQGLIKSYNGKPS